MRVRWLLTAVFAVLWAVPAQAAGAVSLEKVAQLDGPQHSPMSVTSSPANPNRLLIPRRHGVVVQVTPGSPAQVIADLQQWVLVEGGEQGLLSIALSPSFESNGRFYAAYSGTAAAGSTAGNLHVDAFRNVGGSVVREPVIEVERNPARSNHYGGQVAFGPDGYLYVSTGDGGGGGDPDGNGQNLGTLLGAVLRIAPRPGTEAGYSIPPGNPFRGVEGAADEIWAYGLRNPWRFSFDRATGNMTIADVGQSAWEEVNFARSPQSGTVGGAGANYGWPCREGFVAYSGAPSDCPGASSFVDPAFAYGHSYNFGGERSPCSITGGYVVRDPGLPELYGRYVYSDFCTGAIRSLRLPSAGSTLATDDRFEIATGERVISFGEDACGRVYVTTIEGSVHRLVGGGVNECAEPSDTRAPGAGGRGGDGPDGQPQPIALPRLAGRIFVRAGRRIVRPGRRVRIAARVAPCARFAGRRVMLLVNGRPAAVRRLARRSRCTVVLAPRIRRHTRFRFVARNPMTGRPVASRPLVILRARNR